ncbi:hypothetical protein D046_8984, partial [Vibrio parahaemolyticus V-223/04]
ISCSTLFKSTLFSSETSAKLHFPYLEQPNDLFNFKGILWFYIS